MENKDEKLMEARILRYYRFYPITKYKPLSSEEWKRREKRDRSEIMHFLRFLTGKFNRFFKGELNDDSRS